MPLKVVSWNINGIRTLPGKLKETLDNINADIFCFQETKIARNGLDLETGLIDGYNAYFSFSTSKIGYSGVAIFCRSPLYPIRAEMGLGGTLTDPSNDKEFIFPPIDIESEIMTKYNFTYQELKDIDNEGRVVSVQFHLSNNHKCSLKSNESESNCCFTVISVYCPRGDIEKPERLLFKKRFHQLLQWRVEQLLHSGGSHVVIAGDLNLSHLQIDHCEPVQLSSSITKTNNSEPSFTAIIHEDFLYQPARYWIDAILIPQQRDSALAGCNNNKINNKSKNSDKTNDWSARYSLISKPNLHFVDTFRFLHPQQTEAFSCWCSKTGARQTNYGNRIDYILCDDEIQSHCKSINNDDENDNKNWLLQASVDKEIYGSDHCPISATLSINLTTVNDNEPVNLPSICSKYFPQFQGKQKKISDYFVKKTPGEDLLSVAATTTSSSSTCTSSSNSSALLSNNNSRKRPYNAIVDKQPKLTSLFVTASAASTSVVQTSSGNLETTSTSTTILMKKSSMNCSQLTNQWKSLLCGPEKPPICKGHGEPCVLRQVKKDSLNKGKEFWICSKPEGSANNPLSRCNTFIWKENKKEKK